MMTISCIMLVFGLRLGWNISYTSTNTPGELIVYAQGSAEARDVIDDINEIAEKSGGVSEFGLSVDRDTYWGLLWYIREYDNVSYLDTSDLSNEPYGSVLLVSENSQKFSDKYRDQYTSNQEFMYLWWPSEWYKPCGVYRFQGCLNVSNVADAVSKKSNWRDLLHLYCIETYLLLYCLITQKSIMISVRCYITGMTSGVFGTVCITPAF